MDIHSILSAAQERLKEVRKHLGNLESLKAEEQHLLRLLNGHKGSAALAKPGPKAKGKRGGRPAKGGGLPTLALAVDVLTKAKGGMQVKEIVAQLRKAHPGHFKGTDASALLSRALNQSMKAKTPKVKILVRGGPGKPATYGAAAISSSLKPGPKAKGGRPAKAGGASKVALATEVLQKAKTGMTITEMLERLRKTHADQFKAKNAHKMLATALREATKAKPPTVRVLVKGGRGKHSVYGVASA